MMKIGILLPTRFDLGLLRRARRLASLVTSLGDEFSAAIGLPEIDERSWRRLEKQLRDGNRRTVVRRLRWETVPVDNARRMFANLPEALDLDGIDNVVVPRDWGWNFQDCDAVVVFADAALGAVLPLAPTLFYCTDLAARIVPQAFAAGIDDDYWKKQVDAFRMWRQATVCTSDPATADDLVSYAGVRSARAITAPNLLASQARGAENVADSGSTALAWLVSSVALDDLHNAAAGLDVYLSEGGRFEPRLIVDDTRQERPLEDQFGGLPIHLTDVLYGLPLRHVRSDEELLRVLGSCSAIWSSRIAGGEGEAAILAGQAGTAFVGADYAINRATAETQGVSATLYRLDDPLAIADALHQAEALIGTNRSGRPVPNEDAEKASQIGAILQRVIGDRLG